MPNISYEPILCGCEIPTCRSLGKTCKSCDIEDKIETDDNFLVPGDWYPCDNPIVPCGAPAVWVADDPEVEISGWTRFYCQRCIEWFDYEVVKLAIPHERLLKTPKT